MFFDKKGQITVFIVIAVLVVAGVVLIFLLTPDLRDSIGLGGKDSPEDFVRSCIEDTFRQDIKTVSLQGGSMNPEPSYRFDGKQLQYLCYTNEDYSLCKTQIPFIRDNLENELENSLRGDVSSCLDSLEENYADSSLRKGGVEVELLPDNIVLTVNSTFSYDKDGSTRRYDEFKVVENSKLYLLSSISQSILEWEATYGEADTTTYMNLYRDVVVRKKEQTRGTRVYVLDHDETDDKFQFASRSLVFPPGY